MAPPRIIKRYPNRKLYDTEDSRYIKLQDIAGLVQSGIDVRIIDFGRDFSECTIPHPTQASPNIDMLRRRITAEGEDEDDHAGGARGAAAGESGPDGRRRGERVGG